MIVLNFAHPLTEEQLSQIALLVGTAPVVRDVAVQIDRSKPIVEEAVALAEAAGLTSREWQTMPLIVNPPGLAPLALALFAELHGRCGYFLPILNIRPLPDDLAIRYEVAEIVALQSLRDRARSRR